MRGNVSLRAFIQWPRFGTGESGLRTAVDVGDYNRPPLALTLERTHLSNEPVPGLFARMEIVKPVKELLRRTLRRRADLVQAEQRASGGALG